MGVCWTLAVLFSLSVGLQVNDPDPVDWMAMYGVAAITAALLPSRRMFAFLSLVVGIAAAGWSAYLASQVFDQLAFSDLWLKMSEKGGAVEEEREGGGLLINGVWMLAGSWFRLRRA